RRRSLLTRCARMQPRLLEAKRNSSRSCASNGVRASKSPPEAISPLRWLLWRRTKACFAGEKGVVERPPPFVLWPLNTGDRICADTGATIELPTVGAVRTRRRTLALPHRPRCED